MLYKEQERNLIREITHQNGGFLSEHYHDNGMLLEGGNQAKGIRAPPSIEGVMMRYRRRHRRAGAMTLRHAITGGLERQRMGVCVCVCVCNA